MGKFTHGDKVKFKGRVYIVVECHAMNWFSPDNPMVYGLVQQGKPASKSRDDRIYVREDLLKELTAKEKETWSILYGNKSD